MYRKRLVNVLIPILNQYETLNQVLLSIQKSTVAVDHILLFDNGSQLKHFHFDPKIKDDLITVFDANRNVGVAKAWNFMLKNSTGERIVSNDDIIFHPDTIKIMLNTKGNLVVTKDLNAFSLFLIRQPLLDKVGYFDELISPNYGYFEDNDYAYRMKLAGLSSVVCEAKCTHIGGGSRTMNSLTGSRLMEHHMKFEYAKKNYIDKWGGLPGEEKFIIPYNKEISDETRA